VKVKEPDTNMENTTAMEMQLLGKREAELKNLGDGDGMLIKMKKL